MDLKTSLSQIFNFVKDKWYLFLISIAVCSAVAILYCANCNTEYMLRSKILVGDSKRGEIGTQALLRDLGIYRLNSSVENELQELSSYNLFKKVVENLGLQYSVWQKKGMGFSPILSVNGFEILPLTDTLNEYSLCFEIGAGSQVFIYEHRHRKAGVLFESGDTVKFKGVSFILNVPSSVEGKTIMLTKCSVERAAALLQSQFTATQTSARANVIQLTLKDYLPERGKHILNGIVDYYNRTSMSSKVENADSTIAFIDKRLSAIGSDLERIELLAANFLRENHLADFSTRATMAENIKENTVQRRQSASLERLSINEIVEIIDNRGDGFPLLPPTNENAYLSSIIEEYNKLATEHKSLLNSATPQNPTLLDNKLRLESLLKEIRELLQLVGMTIELKCKHIENDENIQDSLLGLMPIQERLYRDIERRQGVVESLYLFLMQKKEEAEMARLMLGNSAKVIESPIVSGVVWPKRGKILWVALVFALALPFLIYALIMTLKDTIYEIADIDGEDNRPVIGKIPMVKNPLVDNRQYNFMLVESIDLLRENVRFLAMSQDCISVLVTSLKVGEGKSFIASHLAEAFARMGKSTILVGCDMRSPQLHCFFGEENRIGLSSFLSGMESDLSHLVFNKSENLSILFGGNVPPNPVQLLNTEHVALLMEKLKEQYKVIVLDTPPIGILSDGYALAPFANVTLCVLRLGVSKKSELLDISKIMADKRFSNMSVVVNGVEEKKSAYGYGYGNY